MKTAAADSWEYSLLQPNHSARYVRVHMVGTRAGTREESTQVQLYLLSLSQYALDAFSEVGFSGWIQLHDRQLLSSHLRTQFSLHVSLSIAVSVLAYDLPSFVTATQRCISVSTSYIARTVALNRKSPIKSGNGAQKQELRN